MGSIESYLTQAGKRYKVRFRKPDHTQGAKRGFTTKRDAELFLAKVEVSKATGDFVDATKARITIAELAPRWLATKKAHLKISSYLPIEQGWRLRVEKRWGKVAVGRVEHSAVQAWIDELTTSGLSASVVLRDYGTLIGILDLAVQDRRIPHHRARGVKLPKKGAKPRRYLSHRQVALLAESARASKSREDGAGEVGAIVVQFLAYTGVRWAEMTGLRARAVNFDTRRFVIEENAVQIGRSIHVGTPKNSETRSAPIPPFLLDALRTMTKEKAHDDLVFGDGVNHLKSPNVYHGWFAKAVETARAADPSFPKITFHDLRHTAASLAISAGANVKALQRMLGHNSAAMTLDTYADLFEDDLDAVAVALDRARENSLASNPRPLELGQ